MDANHLKDGGAKSRKLWYAVGTSVAILICGFWSSYHPTFVPVLAEIVGGLLGALGLYLTGNVGGKAVLGRIKNTASQALPSEESAPAEESPLPRPPKK